MPKGESSLRRPPKQERSRERVDEILCVAKRLIGEKGIDAVKMREIAALSGGPISSVYQYFPNKSAIIATLYSQWSSEVYDLLKSALANINGLEPLFAAAAAILDVYHQRILTDPAVLDLMNAVQADKALKNVDIIRTRQQAHLFCDTARPWIEDDRFEAFSRVTFLMFQLANGTVRLALAVEGTEAQAIISDFKIIIHTQLMEFAKAD
ncbi:MAG: TetR family transcriptional regulator [Rhizobium sp.]|nr:TetR family transcriptional regulator [Rhizobium sp.]